MSARSRSLGATVGQAVEWVRLPPAFEGQILTDRIDGIAYLLGWTATIAHLGLWVVVLLAGLSSPWSLVSTITSVVGTLLFITLVLVIHRRLGEQRRLPLDVVWQWWLGPWDPVGRLVWLPVRLPEALRATFDGA